MFARRYLFQVQATQARQMGHSETPENWMEARCKVEVITIIATRRTFNEYYSVASQNFNEQTVIIHTYNVCTSFAFMISVFFCLERTRVWVCVNNNNDSNKKMMTAISCDVMIMTMTPAIVVVFSNLKVCYIF